MTTMQWGNNVSLVGGTSNGSYAMSQPPLVTMAALTEGTIWGLERVGTTERQKATEGHRSQDKNQRDSPERQGGISVGIKIRRAVV